MKSAIYVINKGFYPSDTVPNFQAIPLTLVQLGFAISALDNNHCYYTFKDGQITPLQLEIEKKYRENSAKIKNMVNILNLTKFEQENIINSIGVWIHEKEFFQFEEIGECYITLFFYPIDLFYSNFSVTAFPTIKIYSDYSIIIEYSFDFNDISISKLQILTSKIETQQILSVGLSSNLLHNINIHCEHEEYTKNVEGNDIEYTLLHNNQSFNQLSKVTDFFLKLLQITNKPTIFYGRNTYILNCSKLSKENTMTFLNGMKFPLKRYNIGKDYRMFKDYCHYLNNSYTLIYGKTATKQYCAIKTIEQRMIIQTIRDSALFDNLAEDKYTYEELKAIHLNMMCTRNHPNLASYSEIDTILRDLHTSMDRSDRIENISNILNQKLKEKEMAYQDRISIVLMLLGCAPLADYIISPLLKIYYNHIQFTYNSDLISIFSFLISAAIIFLIYLILKEKMNSL